MRLHPLYKYVMNRAYKENVCMFVKSADLIARWCDFGRTYFRLTWFSGDSDLNNSRPFISSHTMNI
jgi:hypothetical protein